MNKEQKEFLQEEKKELEGKKKQKLVVMIMGLGLIIFSAFTPGIYWAIIGIIAIVVGGSTNQIDRRIKKINYKLLGDKSKKVKIKKVANQYICGTCNSEVDEGDIRCKKCKSLLAVDGAVKKIKKK